MKWKARYKMIKGMTGGCNLYQCHSTPNVKSSLITNNLHILTKRSPIAAIYQFLACQVYLSG